MESIWSFQFCILTCCWMRLVREGGPPYWRAVNKAPLQWERIWRKNHCALSCPDYEERGEKNVDCVHVHEDCDIYRVLFFLTIPPHFQYQNKKKTCTANEDHFPPFQLWIGSFPGWWGCRGPGFVGLEWFVKMMWNFEGHFIWWSSLTWYGNDITVLQYDDHFCH